MKRLLQGFLLAIVLYFFWFVPRYNTGSGQSNGGAGSSNLRSLQPSSSYEAVDTTIAKMYSKYGNDLADLFSYQRRWEAFDKTSVVDLCHPHMCNIESELLYLRIRESGAKEVFELGPACGWSSLSILVALKHNKNGGHLHSFDIEEKASRVIGAIFGEEFDKSWTFVLGDINQEYKQYKHKVWDYIFIDALHENHFSLFYMNNIIEPIAFRANHKPNSVQIQLHDIYNPFMIGPRYMACVENAVNVAGIKQEIECMRSVTSKIIMDNLNVMETREGMNLYYGPEAISGEGTAVAEHLLLNVPYHVRAFTLSPFRDMKLYLFIEETRKKLGIVSPFVMNIYNPSLFFII